RVSRAGNILPPGGVVGRMTHVGPMARFVEDLILLLPIISVSDPHDPEVVPVDLEQPSSVRLKSLKTAFFFANGKSTPGADLTQAVRSAATVLAEEGAPTEEKCLPGFNVMD